MKTRRASGWLVWSGGLFLLIVIPFVLYGDRMEDLARAIYQSGAPRWIAAFGLGALLVADIALPIPSIGASVTIGALVGFWWGTLISASFMTMACVAGYWIGRRFGRPVAQRLVGEAELRRAESLSQRYGDWAVVGLRGVPVLAEASVVVAGTVCLPFVRFLIGASIANVVLSAVFAGAGAIALQAGPLALASIAAIGFTLLAAWVMNRKGDRPSISVAQR
jgi:uncharacterized membrane protein YdjX (TVP38/TMEM64 family)